MSEQYAVEHINKIAPEHDRTSCNDDNLYNAAYGADDRGGHGRCRRCGLLDIVRRTLAAAPPAAQDASGQWVPVSERLPEDGVEVLTYSPESGGISMSEQWDGDWNCAPGYTISHWRPLPSTPGESK